MKPVDLDLKKYLTVIFSFPEINKVNFKTGTILKISNLKDGWFDDNVECGDFDMYEEHFNEKKSIEDILYRYTYKILNGALGLNQDNMNRSNSCQVDQ